jgi:sortase A
VGRIARAAAVVILLAGIAVLLYPGLAQRRYARTARREIAAFEAEVRRVEQANAAPPPAENSDDAAVTDADGNDAEIFHNLVDLRMVMDGYNQEIYGNGQAMLRDAFSYEAAAFDLTAWGFTRNVVGYLDIPRMDVRLPIYLGATQENMRRGAGHLTQTSLPIGGESTNCVIAAHRGMSTAAMFRDIELLQIGDEITVQNIWEVLTYAVVEIKVIAPTDVREILIQERRDLVTLITCHPYGQNYQRYAVFCERIGGS